MRHLIRIIKAFCLFLLLLLFKYSSSQTLNLNQFGIEQGLPQSSAYTMVQDLDGNIWIGTMGGISKYNGVKFENFDKKNGLAENRTVSSCMDKSGNIWFGHWAGGISKYSPSTKKIEEIITDNIKIQKKVNCIFLDREGSLWFGTEDQGALKYENNIFTQFSIKNGLLGNNVTAIAQQNDGSILIGTSSGLSKYSSGKLSNYNVTLPSNSIQSILIDSKGNTWIGSIDKGVCKINTDKKIKNYTVSNGLANENIRIIFESKEGNIFIGTYGGGVSKYLPQLEKNNYQGSCFQTISTKQGLSNDRVLSIIQDRENNIWIGTYLNLNQYFDEQFEIFGDNEGLENSLVWSVIQSKKGDFWIGTDGGLIQFSSNIIQSNHKEAKYKFKKITGTTGGVLNTNSLYEDIGGNIWYSEFGKGLSRYNPNTKAIDTYTLEKKDIPVNEIYSITGDKYGNVWIGTNNGGLLKFNIISQKFEQFTKENGIGSNQVYTIFKDSKGRLWLGTLSGALTMFDGVTFKKFSEAEGYPSKYTLSITEDSNGDIWIGTFDQGVYKYNGKTFKQYSTKDGLSSNAALLLTTDENNNLWIGSGLGLDRLNIKDEKVKHYEKEDGFLGVEINPNAVCKDSEGSIWFGTIIGLVKYSSKIENTNQIESITSIKSPRLFFKNIDIPANHVFSWNKNHLTFDFIGTSLTNPKRVKYRYMLEGLDTEYSPIVKENSVTYPDLKSGEYTFKVISCNNDGVWNAAPVTFHFVITPPFWKTIWFWSVVGLAIIFIVFSYIKWKVEKLRKQNIILESKVTERTETISKQKIELEKKNIKITDSIDYAKRIQDAIFVSKDEMKKYPFEWFLFFKPKDIVSGDFYWSFERDNKIWVATADCTGHGVPGAFMSIIGYNLLNHAVKDAKIDKPSEILNTLRGMMKDTFSKALVENSQVKDGIAIALICYDKIENIIEYSGSYNSLYHIRDGKLEEYKANRIPIGYSEYEAESGNFITHKIGIKKGDSIYLFTDGFPDQPGGKEKKKFFYAPFKQLLTEIQKQPMDVQKNHLDETLTNWVQNREQIDDITIVGIRF